MDWQKLLSAMVPLGVALAKPGQSGASFVEGFQQSDQMMWKRRMEEEEAARRNAAAQAEMRNRDEDNRRQDQMLRLNRLSHALSQFQPMVEGAVETASSVPGFMVNPQSAATDLGTRAHQLESTFGLDAGALQPMTPSADQLRPQITAAQIRKAKGWVKDYMQQYGDQAGEAAESFTIQSGVFAGLTPKAVMDLAEMPVPPKAKPKPVNKQYQSKEVMRGGKRTTVNFDPDTGAYTDLQGQPVTDISPIPPASAQAQPGGLPPRTQQRVDATTKGFDTQPVVRNIQKQAEAVQFANSLDPNTTNPADDQALIYAFAKAMDPDSVVREGEYQTVQKYAQSWAETFGFNAARIFSNTSFLTAEARRNMKTTIQKKYAASKIQYDSLRKSYGQRIDKITGEAGTGESWLIDYGGGFPDIDAPAPTGGKAPAQVGEERMINGVRAKWDGKGWVKVP